jgi:hypothetical protein
MNPDPTRSEIAEPQRLGRYRLLQKLGEGGMGIVWLAQDENLDRRVAVKVLPPRSVADPGAVARFQREARALAKLSHPGIVQAFDSDAVGDQHLLVMEYVEGQSLTDLLKTKGRIAPTHAADYIQQAAQALAHAHHKGLIHRDLKPSNLLVTGNGQVKVLDLGLARFLQDQISEPNLTREGLGMGTPDYTAPEQFRDAHRADPRSDLYALGCTLYHLLTGRMPFPGSSLSEKVRAHETQEPIAVEELCPEAPAGLALVVRRMMAKRPEDRFQTAQEVVEALAPYVACSSASFQVVKNTSSWHAGQLTITDYRPRRQRWRWAVGGVVLVALALLALVVVPQFWPGKNPSTGNDPGGEPQLAGTPPREKTPPAAKPVNYLLTDDNVLTVSQKPEDGAKYRTINDALKKVTPGKIIRILDTAVYPETIVLTRASQHEGITLETPRGATLAPASARLVCHIANVPNVAVRGFRFLLGKERQFGVIVEGKSPGVMLEDLQLNCSYGSGNTGISLEGLKVLPSERPVVVKNCVLRRPWLGIRISGIHDDGRSPLPCSGILVQHNLIDNPERGITVLGEVQRVNIVANRVLGATAQAIDLWHFLGGTTDILIANNTLFDNNCALRYFARIEDQRFGKNVQMVNNLVLATRTADMLFLGCTEDRMNPRKVQGPGKGRELHQHWRWGSNWREFDSANLAELEKSGWVPPAGQGPAAGGGFSKLLPAAKDILQKEVPVLNRKAGDPDFLRPAADSPLATAGAGVTDPSLPVYIGAVPPQGMRPWDWSRTWQAPPPGKLLTVSKDPQDGGQFRSINEALAAAKPWSTIRVLDSATYEETIILNDAERQEGIALETLKRAVITNSHLTKPTISIRSVPSVRVKGFRFTAADQRKSGPVLVATGHVPGVVFEELDLSLQKSEAGILLADATAGEKGTPLLVRNCAVVGGELGIYMFARELGSSAKEGPCGGIRVEQNRCQGQLAIGILLKGRWSQIQIAGNRISECGFAGLQVEALSQESRQILLVNNTVFDCEVGFRAWDNRKPKEFAASRVELANNLLFGASKGDMVASELVNEATSSGTGNDDLAKSLAASWRFFRNHRDRSGGGPQGLFPLGPNDKQISTPRFVNRKADNPDYLRPAQGEAWAKDGAGDFDGALPPYVGAVPPEGVPPWDWDRTWRSRMK